MSNWIEIKKDDIDIDYDGEELNILYSHDNIGNNYVTVKIKDILDKITERLISGGAN